MDASSSSGRTARQKNNAQPARPASVCSEQRTLRALRRTCTSVSAPISVYAAQRHGTAAAHQLLKYNEPRAAHVVTRPARDATWPVILNAPRAAGKKKNTPTVICRSERIPMPRVHHIQSRKKEEGSEQHTLASVHTYTRTHTHKHCCMLIALRALCETAAPGRCGTPRWTVGGKQRITIRHPHTGFLFSTRS